MKIANVSICNSTKVGKIGWFEGRVTAFTDAGEMQHFGIDFPVPELKEMGVCSGLNDWKRVREWANSDVGNEWIIKNKDRKDMMARLREQGVI